MLTPEKRSPIARRAERIGNLQALVRQCLGRATRRQPRLAHGSSRAPRAERQPRWSAPEQGGERRSAALLVSRPALLDGIEEGWQGEGPRARRFEEAGGTDCKAGLQLRGVAPSRGPSHYTHLALETTHDGGAAEW